MSKVHNCPANVTIQIEGELPIECKGRYYGDGRVICDYEGRIFMVDPNNFHAKNPKRLFDYKTGEWTEFVIKSVVLDSKSIVKNR